MGIQRENGYSASVEAFLVVGDQHIRLAKTGPEKVLLAEPCELAPGTEGELVIIVDGHRDSRAVVLDEGAISGRQEVRYSVAVPSVHDNHVYCYTVDCENERLTLHTLLDAITPTEYTDIVFAGVVAHVLDQSHGGNILFDVSEVPAAEIVDQAAVMLQDSWRYGWPQDFEYKGDLALLKQRLIERKILGFRIEESYGLNGWVLAESCERIPRNAKAAVP